MPAPRAQLHKVLLAPALWRAAAPHSALSFAQAAAPAPCADALSNAT
eukprot:gene11648-8446_t